MQIKYRGKSLSTGGWVYGYLLKFTGDDGNMGCYIFEDNSSEFYSIPEMLIEVDPNTVGQYIGLNDINGKEIYSDDIVENTRYSDFSGETEYYKVCFGIGEMDSGVYTYPGFYFENKYGEKEDFTSWKESHKILKVVANFHDNPDLLTQ